jgi:hypothetical protein
MSPSLYLLQEVISYTTNINLICLSASIKKNTEALLEVSKEVGLDVNTKKTKYIVVSRHQNAEQNHNLLIANKLLCVHMHLRCVFVCRILRTHF